MTESNIGPIYLKIQILDKSEDTKSGNLFIAAGYEMKGFSEDVEDALGLVIDCFCRILRLTNFDSQLRNSITKLNCTKPNEIEPDQTKPDRTKPTKLNLI